MKFHISEGRKNAGLSEELEIRETDGRFYSFTINHEEARCLVKELRQYISGDEPSDMFRAQEGIKHLNLRLRKAEEKIVSLENSNEQRKKELKHSWNLYQEIVKRTEATNKALVEENKKLNAHLIEHYGGK